METERTMNAEEHESNGATGVVIVGTGLIARFHAQAVKASPKLELVAAVDVVKERAERFAAEFGCAAYTDVDAALSRPDAGIVSVATPSGAHDEAVFAAARHRVPALVEKPLAITPERCDAMIEECERTGTPLGCIFQTRFSEGFAAAKRAVESGELGRVTFAKIEVPWWRDDSYYAGTWHGTRKMDGGGALINQAIHMVDWLVALMPPVLGVKAFTATLAHPIETEDIAAAVIRFEGGALGAIYATTASYPGRGKNLEITGTKGTFVWSDQSTGVSRPDQLEYAGHLACFESFAESLRGGKPYAIDGREAKKSVDLIARIYRDGDL